VVTLGFRSVWVTSSGEGKVYRVNPETGKVIAMITVAAKPRFTTIAAGSVWVLSQSDGSVSRIDPSTNTVKSVIKVNVPGEGGDISSGGGWIWVAAAGTPLTRISASTGAIAGQYGNYAGADAIRYGFHAVWISDHRKGDLWKIDPARLPIVR
jgi:YVTN family beta-propeller protein